MKTALLILSITLATPAATQTSFCTGMSCPDYTKPVIPDEAMKKRALQRAYELNGNSMCCGSIDVSQDPYVTGRSEITPETEYNMLDAAAPDPDLNINDVQKFLRRQNEKRTAFDDLCQQHGMHKVFSEDGKSWRCRK